MELDSLVTELSAEEMMAVDGGGEWWDLVKEVGLAVAREIWERMHTSGLPTI